MNKLCLFLFAFCSVFSAEVIDGFWKTIDDKTGKAQSIIAVYEYEGLRYGRIIGSLDDDGEMVDSIYHPVKRAPGLPGNPFYSGLDIIWYLAESGYKFKGRILDPRKGDVYKAELWIANDNLVVRGKLFIFGRSQVWLPAVKSDFPKGFKMPDLKKFIPSIPAL